MKNTEYILGLPVDNLSMQDIVDEIPYYYNKKKKMLLSSLNPQILLMAQKSDAVSSLIKQSTHRFPDGIGIVMVSKLLGGSIKERVAGIDLMEQVLIFADKASASVFLFGAKSDILKLTKVNIEKKYPNLDIVGCIDGYSSMPDEKIVEQINDTGADILFLALGSPKQEEWLANNISKTNCFLYQTVGGSFDVISGTVKRAPQLFIKLNLEWLYRSLSNPKRINRIFQLPVFVVKAVVYNYKKRNARERNNVE